MDLVPFLLASADVAAQAAGAPVAVSLAREITQSCEDVAKHKKHARMLGDKSRQLILALRDVQEEDVGLEGTKMQERVDEVIAALEKTKNRVDKWTKMSVVVRWWRRNEIESGIEQSVQELDTALHIFSLKAQISQERNQNLARAQTRQIDAENKEMLQQILANQQNLAQVVQLHQAGESIAKEVMEEGQKVLKHMRSAHSHGSFLWNKNGERYLDVQRGLMNLHDLTGIPPLIKILDGEIKKTGELAVAGGPSSDIWCGIWLGQKRVALKTIRAVQSNDTKAQKRFVRELNIWSELKNQHILQFYGIVTDIGMQIHMVSPWFENGNVLVYTTKHPEANKLHLLQGAAKGLGYLHSQDITHGNVKCSNILVSDNSEACISDFGMAKVLEDVTKTPITTTLLQTIGCIRWMAPEIIEGESSPSKASDTYSFSMTILELVTGKHPFAEYKKEFTLIRAMTQFPIVLPQRPMEEPMVQSWLTDEMWSLMEKCWDISHNRPTMEDVSNLLQAM